VDRLGGGGGGGDDGGTHIRRAPAALVGETVVATSPTPPHLFCSRITVETTVVGSCSGCMSAMLLTLVQQSCRFYTGHMQFTECSIFTFYDKCGLVAQWSGSEDVSMTNKLLNSLFHISRLLAAQTKRLNSINI